MSPSTISAAVKLSFFFVRENRRRAGRFSSAPALVPGFDTDPVGDLGGGFRHAGVLPASGWVPTVVCWASPTAIAVILTMPRTVTEGVRIHELASPRPSGSGRRQSVRQHFHQLKADVGGLKAEGNSRTLARPSGASLAGHDRGSLGDMCTVRPAFRRSISNLGVPWRIMARASRIFSAPAGSSGRRNRYREQSHFRLQAEARLPGDPDRHGGDVAG